MSDKFWKIPLAVLILMTFASGHLIDLMNVLIVMTALIFLMSEIERS